MAFAGKNRYEETKEEKISKELNEDINNFLKSFASMVGTSAIKENINRMAGSKKANIEEYSKKLEGMLKDAGIANESEIQAKAAEYQEKINKAEALRNSIDKDTKELKEEAAKLMSIAEESNAKNKQANNASITAEEKNALGKRLLELEKELNNTQDKINSLSSKLSSSRKELDVIKLEEGDAKMHLEQFEEIKGIREQLDSEISEHKVLTSLSNSPVNALKNLILEGIDASAEELRGELKGITTEDGALNLIKNNKRFNDALALSRDFGRFLAAIGEDENLARKQGKKMEAELATTNWERLKGRVGPHIGRKSSADVSEKRISNMNWLIDDMARNPEILRAVGQAYMTISVLSDLNRNARKKAEEDKLKKELEPDLNTVKEYLSKFTSNVREIKREIGAESTAATKEDKKQPKTHSSKNATTATEGAYYGWESKTAMNIWLNELDNYLNVNTRQKAIVESEYKKYEDEIKHHKLTMEHALQLYTAVISAKAEVLKSDKNGETHFNHATKHLVDKFNNEKDIEKKKELADMIYRMDLAYTASISKWEPSERATHDEVITIFNQLNSALQLLYPDANTQPEYEKLRKELQKISEQHAAYMYRLLKGRALQIPTNTTGIATLLRTPASEANSTAEAAQPINSIKTPTA